MHSFKNYKATHQRNPFFQFDESDNDIRDMVVDMEYGYHQNLSMWMHKLNKQTVDIPMDLLSKAKNMVSKSS